MKHLPIVKDRMDAQHQRTNKIVVLLLGQPLVVHDSSKLPSSILNPPQYYHRDIPVVDTKLVFCFCFDSP